ncbi:hypothetical protein [Nocardia sp. NPDC050718]|uniref:hypothetical protein n=1 Tax=Nocardia sp. NPDC050718 TaxID=3155788 RepID=UPI0033F5438A
MTDQHSRVRAPGIARVLALLALLAGILAMHSAVFGTAHAAHPGGTESSHPGAVPATAIHPEPPTVANPAAAAHAEPAAAALPGQERTGGHTADELLTAAHLAAAGDAAAHVALPGEDRHAMGSGCGASGCDERAGIHGCVFVLAALAAALTLVLLYRLSDDGTAGGTTATRPWRGRRERPPPWTVLSLAQLAILRI